MIEVNQNKHLAFFTLFFLLSLCLIAQNVTENLRFEIQESKPLGTIYQPGEICHFTWKLVDIKGEALTTEQYKDWFQSFSITISKEISNLEISLGIHSLSREKKSYKWYIPKSPSFHKYWITFDAIPKDFKNKRVSRKILVRVVPFSKEEKLDNMKSCLRVLMDWNGQRGYYNRFSPKSALKRAQKAVDWIVKNVKAEKYSDYLRTIKKIQNAKLKQFTIYTPQKGAFLKINAWLVGYFEQWDYEKEMYVLKIDLPVENEKVYRVLVQKNNRQSLFYHTHIKKTSYTINEFYKIIYLTLLTKYIKTKAYIQGHPVPEMAKEKHLLRLYSGKVQVIHVHVNNGPVLKVILNPKYSLRLSIERRSDEFSLHRGAYSYSFSDNEVSLLDFQ